MKATVWLWPIVTLICVGPFVGVYAQQEYQSYVDFPSDNSLIQNYYGERNKRGRGSLSIVNPIDVLRQRLLLEIARRQMKANSKQVEINRAYLKAIGKRDTANKLLQQQQKQQQQQENQQYSQIQTLPLQQEQHTQHEQNSQVLQQRQLQQQQNRNHLLSHPNSKLYDFLRQQQQYNGNIIGIGNDGTIPDSTLSMVDLKDNIDIADNDVNDRNNDDDDDYQIRYLYRLHKNRFLKE